MQQFAGRAFGRRFETLPRSSLTFCACRRAALRRFDADAACAEDVLAVVLLFGCGGDGPTAPSGPGGGPAGGSPGGGGNPIPGPGLTLALGTLRVTGAQDASCPPGERCQEFEVSCPGVVGSIGGFVAVTDPIGAPRGVVVFTTGSGGENYALGGGEREALQQQLQADGFRVVQLRWAANWIEAERGNDAGTARLACRPATAFKWIHATQFLPLGIPSSSNGRCGFCLTGNSGGASQVSFALSHYGLDDVVDAIIPTGGPPHGALTKACLRRPGEDRFWFPDDTRQFIDRGFGVYADGPCFRNDVAFSSRWDQESIAPGGSDYTHPATRVHFIIGDLDRTNIQGPADDYAARLRTSGSPWVTIETAAGTPHSVLGSAVGRSAVRAALLATR